MKTTKDYHFSEKINLNYDSSVIHQTINWPNKRVPVFLRDAQYKLPSSAKLSNRSSFLAAFFFRDMLSSVVMRARKKNEFESERGQKLAVLVAYSTVI